MAPTSAAPSSTAQAQPCPPWPPQAWPSPAGLLVPSLCCQIAGVEMLHTTPCMVHDIDAGFSPAGMRRPGTSWLSGVIDGQEQEERMPRPADVHAPRPRGALRFSKALWSFFGEPFEPCLRPCCGCDRAEGIQNEGKSAAVCSWPRP